MNTGVTVLRGLVKRLTPVHTSLVDCRTLELAEDLRLYFADGMGDES